MSIVASKSFGPTDSVADTKTQVGSSWNSYGKSMTITSLRVAKGNVVDAKVNAGIIEVEVATVNGPFQYAYGNGVGAATIGNVGPAEIILCSIPVPPSALVKVYVTDADVAKDVTVSLSFSEGMGQKVRSYGALSTGGATAADTEESMGTQTIVQNGTIKEIRFAGSGIVDAKAASAILRLTITGYEYDLEFAVGNGAADATGGGGAPADVINGLALRVLQNQVITAYIKSAEIMADAPAWSFQVA